VSPNTIFSQRFLITQKPKKNEEKMTRRQVREWIHLLESSLALSSWLKSESVDRKDLEHRISIIEDGISEIRESYFQRQIRRYMKLFKRLVRREKGSGLDLVKFHQLLHIFKYVLHHGSLANCDGSRPEAVGKFLIKNPGRRTQIRLSLLTIQTAAKMVQQRNIHDFAKVCLRRNPRQFHSKKLYKFYMFSEMSNEDSDDNSVSSDSSDDEDQINVDDEQELIMNGRLDNDRHATVRRRNRISYELSGSVYELYISALDNKMKVNWLSKIDYRNLWKKRFLTGLERRLFLEVGRAGGTVNIRKSIIGRTSLKVFEPNKKPIRYNAHPNYRSGLPWYDWVMLNWGDDGIIPARLLMILETTNLTGEDDIIYYGNEPIDRQLLRNQTSLLKPNSIYLVCKSARSQQEPHDENEYKFSSRLSYHVTLEDNFSIVSVGCLVGPAYVIANEPYGHEGNAENIKNFIVVKDMQEWQKYFINRDDLENFGPVPLNNNNA